MTISLRPYQEAGIEAIRAAIRSGARRVLAVAATGAGKTIIATSIIDGARRKGRRSLFLAPRREIISQTYRKLIEAGLPHDDVGVILAGVESGARSADPGDPWRLAARRPGASVQVASVDTLRNRAKPLADLVFLDEAHRSIAPSYEALLASYPEASVVGLTATPWRADGKGFRSLYQGLVVVAPPKTLMDAGFLVEPRVWSVPSGSLPDLSGVRVKGGDYDATELARACDRATLVGDIVEHWQRHAPGQRTVCFAASVEHSKHIAERFRAAGIAAEHLDGETDIATRAGILGRLASGETLVVCNCAVLTEGWDMPAVSCCILARPTKSTTLYIQCAGRVLRPAPGKAGAVILDHAGCALEHGLPHEEREYSLDAPKKRKRGAAEDCAKMCPECFAVLALGTVTCPECSAELPRPERRGIEETGGELVEVKPGAHLKHLQAWSDFCDAWREENARRMATETGRPRKAGWLLFAWKKRHGYPPPRGVKMPRNSPEELARIAELDGAKAAAELAEVVSFERALPKPSAWAAEPVATPMRRVAW